MSLDDDYESIPNTTMTTNMLAGALAGITEHCVMYPIDNIKTRMQMIPTGTTSVLYSSVVNAMSRISTQEGMYALWRGVSSMIMGAGPSHALYFATYEKCKQVFGADGEDHNHLATGAAGACASIAADGLMNPFDVIKQRLQLPGTQYKGVVDCGLSVFKAEGFGAFYISYPTTLIMNVPFQSIHFITYEYFRKTLNPSGAYDPKTHIVAGALAGAFASAATNPLDVAKTLLQTKGTSSDEVIRRANGFSDAVKLIYQRQGWSGFMKGMSPRILANMPATAISWTTYEFLKHFLTNNTN